MLSTKTNFVPLQPNCFFAISKSSLANFTYVSLSINESVFKISKHLTQALVPDGLESGCRYARRPGTGKVVNGFYELTLGPACQAAARIAR